MTQHLVNTNTSNKLTVAQYMKQPAVKSAMSNALGGDNERTFRLITQLTSVVSSNPQLAECDNATIITAGLKGESLKLSPSNEMGQYYLVPFNDSKNGRKVAQFQLGYKGYVQLAMRSGQYKHINVLEVKEGELISSDPFNEEYIFKAIQNPSERRKAKTTGYYAMIELINGFKKSIYWDKEQMEYHAMTYSKGYKAKKGYTFWEKNFDEMAKKTLLRQIISKWGVMSIDMQQAYQSDMAVINEDNSISYVDSVDFTQGNAIVGSEKEAIQEVEEVTPETENEEVSLL